MDPLDDVALLQIAVLQQDLLERDVEEARKRKRRRRPRRYQTRPWLAEERRRLHGHYARLMEELRVEDAHSPSSTTSGWSLPCLMSWCREWGQGQRSRIPA